MLNDKILHDLKNPLTGITGSIGLFLDGSLGKLSKEQLKYLANIEVSAKKLALMLQELGFVNKIDNNDNMVTKSDFPVGELLQELAWLKPVAGKEDKTIVMEAPHGLRISANKELTVQICTDLLLYAIKQIERGGQITFTLNKCAADLALEIFFLGECFPTGWIGKAFDRDFSTKYPDLRTRVSPGVGFYFCKLAAEAQGGKIGIENVPGGGLRLSCLLPQA
jgi:signal transduction histidine kinase